MPEPLSPWIVAPAALVTVIVNGRARVGRAAGDAVAAALDHAAGLLLTTTPVLACTSMPSLLLPVVRRPTGSCPRC